MDQQIENLDFKPLHDGLGFHHSRKFQNKKEDKPDTIRSFSSDPTLDTQDIPLGLSPFYTNNDNTKDLGYSDYKKFEDFDEEILVLAAPNKRLIAWCIDTGIVMGLMVAVLSLISVGNKLSFSEVVSIIKETPMRWTFFFVLVNLFYFTVLEKSSDSTVGKYLMKIKVKSVNDEKLTLDHTLARAVVGIGNILTMGFLAVFSFQDKISETQVIEK